MTPTEEQIKEFKLCCPLCTRTFGFEKTRVKGIYRCKGCGNILEEKEVMTLP